MDQLRHTRVPAPRISCPAIHSGPKATLVGCGPSRSVSQSQRSRRTLKHTFARRLGFNFHNCIIACLLPLRGHPAIFTPSIVFAAQSLAISASAAFCIATSRSEDRIRLRLPRNGCSDHSLENFSVALEIQSSRETKRYSDAEIKRSRGTDPRD